MSSDRGKRQSGWVIAGAVLLALVVGLIAVAAVAYVAVDSSAPPRPQQQQPIVVPADAPAGDFFTVLRPGVGGGVAAEQEFVAHRFAAGPLNGFVPGSMVHVATARSGWGQADMFRWEGSLEAPDGVRAATCSGWFSNEGAGHGCGNAAHGNSASSGSDGFTHHASVEGVAVNAAWLVVDTQAGSTAVANVVNGSSYAQWNLGGGDPVRVVLLDANHHEVSSWNWPS